MCRARLTAEADWLIWCVSHPTYQMKWSGAHALLDDSTRGPLGLDGDDGVDEGGGVDHPQRVAEVAPPTSHR